MLLIGWMQNNGRNKTLSTSINDILSYAETRQDSVMFLFFLSATDESKRILRFLKGRMSYITKILHLIGFNSLTLEQVNDVVRNDNTSHFLDNENIIERALAHWILLKSLPCIEYIFTWSQILCLRVNVNISTVSALITDFSDKNWQTILKYFLGKNIILNFTSKRNKALQRMSTDFNMFLSDDKKNDKVFSESINDSRSEYKIDDTEYAIYLNLLNDFNLEKVLNLFQFQELKKMKKSRRIIK